MKKITLTAACAMALLILMSVSCASNDTITLTPPPPTHVPITTSFQVITIGEQPPPEIIPPQAKRYYREAFRHMRDADWFYAVAIYSEVIHIQFRSATTQAARGTANLYNGNRQDAIRDYTSAIKLAPDNPSFLFRRAYAAYTADPPDKQTAVSDTTQAIELDPTNHMGYNQRAIAYTLPPNPDWTAALADMDQSISLNTQHDSQAYMLRAWIHENLGNHQAAQTDREAAQTTTE